MKLSAGIAVVGIVFGGWGVGGRAAGQEFAAPGGDRYAPAAAYAAGTPASAPAATSGVLPAYAAVTTAAPPTAMAPNPLRPNSAAAANPSAPGGPSDAHAGEIPTLRFDARVEPAAAVDPAMDSPVGSPPLPTDPAEELAATAPAPGVDPTSPAAAGLEFTLPPAEPTVAPVSASDAEDAAAPAAMAMPPAVEVAAAPDSYVAPPLAAPPFAAPPSAVAPASEPSPYGGSYALDPTRYDEPESRRLAPAGGERPDSEALSSAGRRSLLPVSVSQLDGMSTAGAGLAIAVGLFLVCVWMVRRTGPKPAGVLPSDAFAVLGRAPLTAKSFAQLLRVGNKLVLVAVSADGTQPLAEVTDPDEVDRLTGLCHGSRPGGHSAEFQQVLAQLSKEPARGFLGREGSSARRRAA